MAHVISRDLGNIQTVRDNGVEASLKCFKLLILVEEPDGLAPEILDNAKQYGMQYLGWSVLMNLNTWIWSELLIHFID